MSTVRYRMSSAACYYREAACCARDPCAKSHRSTQTNRRFSTRTYPRASHPGWQWPCTPPGKEGWHDGNDGRIKSISAREENRMNTLLDILDTALAAWPVCVFLALFLLAWKCAR